MNEYTALVTGASSGIGKAIYQSLYKSSDFTVYGLSRRGPDITMDISKLTNYDLDNIYKICGPLNLLINCAGIMPLNEVNKERMIFDTNFWGAYTLIQNTRFAPKVKLPDGREKRKAVIINIASVSGMIAEPDIPIYAASKAALISLTKSLAKGYATLGIRVNCISPGFFNTNLVPTPPTKEMISQIPLKRMAEPEEILKAVCMIWHSEYMTGANIVIDGGVIL